MLYRTINVLSWQWIVSNLGRSKEGLHWAIVKVILWTLLPCTQKETSKLNLKLEPIKKLREFKLKCKKKITKKSSAHLQVQMAAAVRCSSDLECEFHFSHFNQQRQCQRPCCAAINVDCSMCVLFFSNPFFPSISYQRVSTHSIWLFNLPHISTSLAIPSPPSCCRSNPFGINGFFTTLVQRRFKFSSIKKFAQWTVKWKYRKRINSMDFERAH